MENNHKRSKKPFKSTPNAEIQYSQFSLKQLNLMFAALPDNNPNKDLIAQEIDRRVDVETTASGERIKKSSDGELQKAYDTLGI